ncbi:MAG: hypothetical protein MAG581_00987 [Deltaproteobacteria bacterium]|nr:hypothetical protein [Deltaproteobacteria bacterium]
MRFEILQLSLFYILNFEMRYLKTFLAIVSTVIIASCAKQLPKPSKEIKSILVIPAEVINKTQMERKFDYIFNFQSKPDSDSWYGNNSPQNDQLFSVRSNLQKDGNSLTIVSGLSPGEHRLFSMTENPINVRNVNPNTERMRHRPFVLEEGKVLIYPYELRYSQEFKGTTQMFNYSRKFEPLTDQGLKNVKEELKQYKNYELWALRDKIAEGALTEQVTSTESNKIPEKFTSGLELDVGVNSKYKLSSDLTWLSASGEGEADLEGNDIRFVYIAAHGISWGIRMSEHNGKDSTATSYFSIKVTENTPYIRYDHTLYSNDNFLLEGQIAAGFNLVTVEIDHPELSPNASSSLGFMLEPSIFTGMEIQDEMLFGLGMSYPLDYLKGNANWLYSGYTLNYNYEITKSPIVFLIFRFSI